jgi:hypothetical protein
MGDQETSVRALAHLFFGKNGRHIFLFCVLFLVAVHVIQKTQVGILKKKTQCTKVFRFPQTARTGTIWGFPSQFNYELLVKTGATRPAQRRRSDLSHVAHGILAS